MTSGGRLSLTPCTLVSRLPVKLLIQVLLLRQKWGHYLKCMRLTFRPHTCVSAQQIRWESMLSYRFRMESFRTRNAASTTLLVLWPLFGTSSRKQRAHSSRRPQRSVTYFTNWGYWGSQSALVSSMLAVMCWGESAYSSCCTATINDRLSCEQKTK